MNIKICCDKMMTTKTSKYIGYTEGNSYNLLLFNCPFCNSTKAKKVSKRKKVSNDSAEKTIRIRAA